MIVPINEQYRITTDPYQWIVQKKRTRKDQDGWESVTYHPTFRSAVQSLGELMVRRSDAATLADALVDVEYMRCKLAGMVQARRLAVAVGREPVEATQWHLGPDPLVL